MQSSHFGIELTEKRIFRNGKLFWIRIKPFKDMFLKRKCVNRNFKKIQNPALHKAVIVKNASTTKNRNF